MKTDVKLDIVAKRLERIAVEGYAFGHEVPETRQVPVVPFDRAPFVVCEVKRRSPSRGAISADLNAVEQARRYVNAGIKTISVLTEEDYFSGSLQDLIDVKNAFPQTAILRKDFLVRREDVDVSYRAGADAVLLIASILSDSELKFLKEYAESLGLSVFLEVHDEADVAKTRPLKPAFTGINCRDLTDFSIDRAIPLMTRPSIDWTTRLVFESGIFKPEEANWAGDAGFQGVLVGEGAVKNPNLAAELSRTFRPPVSHHPASQLSFWAKLYAKKRPGRPLVKICGLAHRDDVELADECGADLLGFIFAVSKRQVDPGFVRSLGRTKALKVGVVVLKKGERLPELVEELLEDGYLDAVQFHGEEDGDLLDRWSNVGYKALAIASTNELVPYSNLVAPRILFDAQVKDSAGRVQTGGTGTPIATEVLDELTKNGYARKLWLAGGLNAQNIRSVVQTWRPELVDASSGLESSPGRKDPAKVKSYFAEIEHARLS